MNQARMYIALLLLGVSTGSTSFGQTESMIKEEFAHNPALKYHPLKQDCKGTPISKGRYFKIGRAHV